MVAAFLLPDVERRVSHVPAESIVLGQYTFLPYHRTGAAAGLRTPFSTALSARATLSLTVPVTSGATTVPAATTLRLRGPGDVLTIDRRQVVRRYPEPGTPDAEPSDLAHIEFDTPDLPWQFTPSGPDAAGNLPPWLRLVVLPAASVVEGPPRKPGLPTVISVLLAELPPPDEAWAWAHVQVIGTPAGPPLLSARLSGASPTTNLSRLLCPRRLERDTAYIAAVVPTFEVGRLAGMNEPVPVGPTLAFAWGPGSNDRVDLPAYDLWRFATGADGDFEALAQRLLPVAPPPGVGRRRVDTRRPGLGIEPVPGEEVREVFGPLVRVGDPTTDGRSWPPATTEALRQRVDAPDEVAFAPGEASDPTLGPPLYAGAHLARRTVPAAGAEPEWARTLNLDPADRFVAGLGTRVVQAEQEALMTSAWAQVEGVVAANAALSAAALGRFVGESLHRRQLGRMAAADLAATTARAQARIVDRPGQTVAARIGASALPPAAVGPLLRRMARPTGPIARFAGATLGERVAATRSLRAVDGQTRDWVRPYAEPDGVRGVADSTMRLLLDLLAEQADLLARAQEAIAAESFLATMGDPGVGSSRLAEGVARVGAAAELERLLEALLTGLPGPDEIRSDPEVTAPLVRDLVGQATAVLELGPDLDLDRWSLTEGLARRLELDGEPDDTRPERVRVEVDRLQERLFELWRLAGRFLDLGDPVPSQDTRSRLDFLLRAEDGVLAADLDLVRDGLAVETPRFGDRTRESLAIADLRLLERLDPRVTSVRRVRDRLTAWPTWLPDDWFDDTRLERVMVAPRFRHPMYEALDRYDREWLLPGVGAISPQEMVTLLSTNPRFVESFLIGLNTEMARELLWREYPTDGRATSFRSFWTRDDELLAEVHALGPGPLGTHLDSRYAGATVLLVRGELVRRYPDVLAHAVIQTGPGRPPTFAETPVRTLFRLHLAPDLLLIGVDVKSAAVVAADRDLLLAPPAGAYWFVLSEHVGQPRFGLDEAAAPAGPSRARDDLTWDDFAPVGHFLRAAGPTVPVSDRPPLGGDAAMLGWLLFQQPSRAAFRGARMIAGMS